MNFLYFNRSLALKGVTPTQTDRILELVSLAIAICLLTLTLVFFLKAPAQIPVHFNSSGQPDQWQSRGFYWILCGIALLVMGLTSLSAYYPGLYNLPFLLKTDRLEYQIPLLGLLSRLITLETGLLFLSILFMTAAPQLGYSTILFFLCMLGTIFCILITSFILLIRIWLAGRI